MWQVIDTVRGLAAANARVVEERRRHKTARRVRVTGDNPARASYQIQVTAGR